MHGPWSSACIVFYCITFSPIKSKAKNCVVFCNVSHRKRYNTYRKLLTLIANNAWHMSINWTASFLLETYLDFNVSNYKHYADNYVGLENTVLLLGYKWPFKYNCQIYFCWLWVEGVLLRLEQSLQWDFTTGAKSCRFITYLWSESIFLERYVRTY